MARKSQENAGEKIRLLAGNRQPHESYKAIIACNDYLRLGPMRTAAKLLAFYAEKPENTPTTSINTIQDWQARYFWRERAGSYDQRIEDRKTAVAEKAMLSGLALPYERVIELKKLYWEAKKHLLQTAVSDGQPVTLGSGEVVKFLDTRVMNQLRGTLDDLAKETGGRVQKTANTVNGKDVPPPVTQIVVYRPEPEYPDEDSDGDEVL